MDLAVIWILIIGFGIIMYVVLDGFTLGTGIISIFLSPQQRELAMSMILPTWDGNQTWLVLGAATLYGAFPLAFSILLPILYLPLLLMVVALLFRGVAFEFRHKSGSGKKRWDLCFCLGSLAATFIQGSLLGSFLQGFQLSSDPTLPVAYQWLTPFSGFTGLSLVYGYMLLGSTRLVLKSEGSLQDKAFRFAKFSAIAVAICLLITSIWTPFVHPLVESRWLNSPYLLWISLLPITAALAMLGLFYALLKKNDFWPYWLSIVIFLSAYGGCVISAWPYIVPYSLTIWQAASPNNSLAFMLVGAMIMLPLLMIYTWYAYYIFRGKVKDVEHY